jgi:hypothetical protein
MQELDVDKANMNERLFPQDILTHLIYEERNHLKLNHIDLGKNDVGVYAALSKLLEIFVMELTLRSYHAHLAALPSTITATSSSSKAVRTPRSPATSLSASSSSSDKAEKPNGTVDIAPSASSSTVPPAFRLTVRLLFF